MNLLIISDLHLNHQPDGGNSLIQSLPEADACVIAGDLSTAKTLHGHLNLVSKKWPEVIFVPGNHDWYFGSVARMKDIRSRIPNNVHWLDRDTVTIGGQRFAGATLWYQDTRDALLNTHCMTDFYVTPDINEWIWGAFKRDRAWIESTVKSDDIVITHHLPSVLSVAPKYARPTLNCYFVGDVGQLLERPKMWIHGHTHESCDYKVGECRVICNPFGYPRERGNFECVMIEV